jgi:adenylate cyclase class 2
LASRLEVEVKIPLGCEELEALKARLERSGARVEGPIVEEDVYLLHPCRDTLSRDEAIRVRLAGDNVRLAYKGPRLGGGEVKARLEIEVETEPGILDLFRALGFREGLRVRKRRIYAWLERALVTLDEVDGLGCFVEVESLSGDTRDVEDAIDILGLAGRPRVTESYASMLARRLGLPYQDRDKDGNT